MASALLVEKTRVTGGIQRPVNNIKLRNQLGRIIPTHMSRYFLCSDIVDIGEIVNYHCLNNEGKSE